MKSYFQWFIFNYLYIYLDAIYWLAIKFKEEYSFFNKETFSELQSNDILFNTIKIL